MADAKMTIKQRKWLDAYLETGNATEAARRAGYGGSDEVLSRIGSENVRKLQIPVAERMDALGLDDHSLMCKVLDGLDATQVKTASDKGVISDERVYADFATRCRYLELALRLKGLLDSAKKPAQDGEGVDAPSAPVTVVINAPGGAADARAN